MTSRPRLTPEAWREVEALFDRVQDMTPRERREALQAPGVEPWLRAEVESLLRAAESESLVLDEPAAEFVGASLDRLEGPGGFGELPPGTRLGPYRLVSEAGRGGMSVVFLAERDDGVHSGKVALKVLNRTGADDELVHRFNVERRILASLAHPNIARILDGGVTQGGQPYLVMDFVEGSPITAYCAEQRLDLRSRIRLFLSVCDAVQHAHERLVVHRDLKPSNVFVDREGHVRLLDFGIAKLIGGGDDSLVTGTGVRLMTPECAAPEQVRGGAITTSTDVYALGVMLYELLAGSRPYRLDDKSPAEMERIVCEDDPSPPSTRRAAVGSGQEETVALQDTVRRQARGDLDLICLKALAKEPRRRYGTARALAEDLMRHLDGHPVLARPTTAAYRAGKFVRRHKGGVAVSALAVLLLVVFSIGMTMQQVATTEARDNARAEAEKARQVSGFLVDLFQAPDPYNTEDLQSLSAAQLLDRGMERVDAVAGDAVVQGAMLRSMGRANIGLGRYAEAESLLLHAVQAAVSPPGGPLVRDAAEARVLLGIALQHLGRFDEAESANRQALRALGELGEPSGELAGAALSGVGVASQAKGRYEAADSALVRALEVLTTLHGPNDPERLDVLNNLGALRADQGQYEEALQVQQEVYTGRLAAYRGAHPKVAESLSNLGYYHRKLGRYAEAESLYLASIAMKEQTLGANHPGLATTYDNLGVALGIQGKLDDAEAAFRASLDILRERVGDAHPAVATAYNNLAQVQTRRGDYDGALQFQLRALEIRRTTLGDEHPLFAQTLGNLGSIYQHLDRLPDAIAAAEQAVAIEESVLPENHPDLASSLGDLGYYYYRMGNFAAAESLHTRALNVRRTALGENHPDVATSWRSIALVQRDRGELEAARVSINRARVIREDTLGPDHPRTAECLDIQGVIETRSGEFARADSLLEAALAVRKEKLGVKHPDTQSSWNHLAENFALWGKPAEADRVRRERTAAGS